MMGKKRGRTRSETNKDNDGSKDEEKSSRRSSSGHWAVEEKKSPRGSKRLNADDSQKGSSTERKRRSDPVTTEDTEKTNKRHKRSDKDQTRNQESDAEDVKDVVEVEMKKKRHRQSESESTGVKKKTKDEESLESIHISKRLFENSKDAKALVIFNHPEKYILKGRATITCLKGGVNILGSKLTSDQGPLPVYSPESNSLLTIETAASNAASSNMAEIITGHFSEENKEIQRIISKTKDSVVVLVEKLETSFDKFVSSISPFRDLFSMDVSKQRLLPTASVLKPSGLGLYSWDVPLKRITIPRDYGKVDDWMSSRLIDEQTPVIVICGGQNSGKSTLTRYLINKALNLVPGVAVLDCDLGQTEFTGPGCVSVTTVTQPVLGPPFTHLRKNLSCCFLGHLSPSEDVDGYIRCLEHIHSKYTAMEQRSPLIVNTMGWNKGLGLILLARTLRMLKPDLIVQLDCEKSYKNMPLLTSGFIEKNYALTPEQNSEESFKSSHSLISINSVTERENDDVQDFSYRAPDHRTLSLLANFSSALDDADDVYNFNSAVPYELPWRQVAVHIAHQTVPRSQVLYALNASVVGLCVVNTDVIVDSGIDDYPKFIEGSAIFECVGFGIIRAINSEKKVFYVVTSLPPEECARVNCLVRGAVDIPQQLLMDQKCRQKIPYIGNPKDVTGASCVNRRRHMMRK